MSEDKPMKKLPAKRKDTDISESDEDVPEDGSVKKAVAKRGRAPMGPSERKAAKALAIEKQQALLRDIGAFLDKQEEEFRVIADQHGVAVDRVRQLALNEAPIKNKRKVSDWNIALHFKNKEVNGGSQHINSFF
jgi:hypothetical protein